MVRIKHRYIVCRLQTQYYESRPDFASIRSSDILKSIRTEFQLLLRSDDVDLSVSSKKRKRTGVTCTNSTISKKKKSDVAADGDMMAFPKAEEEEAYISLVPQQALLKMDKEAERTLLDSLQVTFHDPKDSQVFVVRCLREHLSLLREAVGKVTSVKKSSMTIQSFIVAGSARTCEKKLDHVLTFAKAGKTSKPFS